MVTDTTEKGLEALITKSLTSNGWLPGDPQDYLPAHCIDLVLSHLWNSSYREATCSAVPCKPMQHLPNPTFDFTVD